MRCLVLLLPLCLACGRHDTDRAADREALLRIHQLQRRAHLERRAELMTGGFADSLIQVARGEVSVAGPEESRARLQRYFDHSTFQAWDDLAPPLIRVSPDGRMAYKVVRKRVRLTAPDSTGSPVEEHTVFAWVEVYQKIGGRWTLMVVASTDRPGP